MAKISIIVPVYNVEKYLRRCLDSILCQTFPDFELILVDDGSTDDSGRICDEYAAADPRVTVIHQENRGVSAVRNVGLDYVMEGGSEWITFIDSDDYIVTRYLEALYNAAQGYGISIGGRALTDGEDLPEYPDYPYELRTPADLAANIHGNFTMPVAKLYRRELFSEIRYPAGRMYEDTFITHRILFRFDVVPFIPRPLYAHHLHPESITQRPWSPVRLDILDATLSQLSFYYDNGYPDLAGDKFRVYIKRNFGCQRNIRQYRGLSKREKRQHLRRIRRQLLMVLFRYSNRRKCHWMMKRKDIAAAVEILGLRRKRQAAEKRK